MAAPRSTPPARTRSRSRWTGLSAADRKAERRRLLLEAAFDLLGSEGWSATTVRAVVERASLNPRYFYESFKDLDELVVAVYDSVVEQMGAVVIDALAAAGDEPADQITAGVGAIIDFVDADRRRGRVLYVEGLGNEALNHRRLEAGQAVVAFVERFAADQRAADHRATGPGEPIGRVAGAILVGGFSQLLVEWLEGRIRVSKATLATDAAELFLAIGRTGSSIADRRAAAPQRGRRPGRPDVDQCTVTLPKWATESSQ